MGSQSDNDDVELIEGHIERHLGSIESVFHEPASSIVHIDVHKIPPRAERNFFTLVTTGMSDLPMKGPEGDRYAELLMSLPSDWPLVGLTDWNEETHWPVQWLRHLARFPHANQTWLGWGHTIPHSDPPTPFAANTSFTCMLLLPPILTPDAFRILRLRDHKLIEFLALIPLYTEEMDFKLKSGTKALTERFNAQGISELLDINRPNVCKS